MLRHRRSLSALYLPAVCGLLFSSSLARANPTGAQVVNGAVSMETIGNTLKITAPDRSIIHWQNFSIAAGETTQFIQPGSMATVLNRVTSGEVSHLMGTLQANGRVYLLNPNGIFIGNGAVVDVGSFMATTAHLTDEAFLKGGDFQLTGASDAPIRNAGTVTARNGDVFLLAQVVENRGTIRAAQGTVGLMAGRDFYVKKEEAGSVKVMVNAAAVPGAKKGIGVDNRGTIEALRANLEADGNAYALAINQAGVVRATGVNKLVDGTVALSAPGGKILNSGQIMAANQNGSGGKISASGTEVVFEAASMVTAAGAVDGGEVKIAAEGDSLISGGLSVDGATGEGGQVEITGNRVGLLDAEVTANGATGGGEVLVGGDYQGLNPLVKNASRTFVSKDSVISADGTVAGDGGKVIVWSDHGTQFYGNLSATGGSVSGDGGFAEVSGKDWLSFSPSKIDLRASHGQRGMLLLDPRNITINLVGGDAIAGNELFTDNAAGNVDFSVADVVTALDGADLTLQANNNISIEDDLDASGNASAGNLTLQAGKSISLETGVDLILRGSFTATANDSVGVLAAGTEANRTAGNGNFSMSSTSTIETEGTIAITIGPADVGFDAGTITLGNSITSTGAQTYTGPVTLEANTTLTTSGGDIIFGSDITGAGFNLDFTTGTGDIRVVGVVGSNGDELGDLRVVSANDVTFQNTLDIASYIQNAGTGTTEFQANLEAGAGFSFTGNELKFATGSGNNVVGGDITIDNTGDLTVANTASLAVAGIFEQNGPGDVILGGDIFSQNSMTFATDVSLTADVTLQNTAGNIELQGAVLGASDLTVTAYAGEVIFGGTVGVGGALTSLTVSGAGIRIDTTAITTSGAQNFSGPVTLGAGTTLTTTDSDVSFTGATTTLSGAQTLAIAAGTGTVTFGGSVGAGALTALAGLDVAAGTIAINGGRVETTGAQLYTGAVKLGDDTTLTTTDSDVTFHTSVSTIQNVVAQTLTIAAGTGTVTFGGGVGGGATALQSLEVTGVGGNIQMDGGAVTTVGLQNYAGTVDLGVDTTLTTAGGDITFGAGIGTSAARDLTMETGSGDIRVAGSVGSNADELGALAIVSAKDVTFEGTVDVGTFAQSSGAGTTQFEANLETGGDFSFTGLNLIFLTASANNTIGGDMDVSMSGALTTQSAANLQAAGNFTQTGAGLNSLGGDVFAGVINFSSGITLTANGIVLQTATGDVVLQGTIQGPYDLTVTSAGDVTLGGAVGTGALAALNSLAVTGDTIAINGGGVRTTGAAGQLYTGAVTLGADTTLTTSGDLVTFTSTIRNPLAQTLTIAAGTGLVTFGGAVGGGGTALSSLAVTGGAIAINGGAVTTDGPSGQVYTGAVTLGADMILTTSNDPILFAGAGTVSGGQTLEIAAGTGTVTFGGGVGTGALAALVSLEVTGGTIAINGNGVRTTGAAGQLYTGAVTVGSSATLSTSDDAVTFAGAGTVNGPGTLEILAGSATVTFGGAVGGANPLASLAVTGGTIAIEGGEITTAGAQLYTGAVNLGADTRLATTDSALSFSSTIQNATARALEIVAGTGVVTFAGAVGGGATALESLEVSAGGIAIQGGSVRTSGAGGQIYDGAVSASTVSFAAGAGSIDLRNNGNDFTGSVTILSGNAITLIDANALSLAGATTSAGQVFVAGGNLGTAGAYVVSGAGDLLLESGAGQVTLGAGTSYAARNITVVVADNQSFINQAGAAPFTNTGGRTLVFSTKARMNSPSQLNGGFSGFQPYFNTVPEVVIGPALGTYSVLNSLPGGNLMVYRPPGSSPVHPDHISQATVNSIVNTEAFQTTVPIITYSLLSLPRGAVKIRYRMTPDQAAPVAPRGLRRQMGELERPSAEAKRRQSSDFGGSPQLPAGKDTVIHLGEISIMGARVTLKDEQSKIFTY